jgi:hypothetical protein
MRYKKGHQQRGEEGLQPMTHTAGKYFLKLKAPYGNTTVNCACDDEAPFENVEKRDRLRVRLIIV